MSIQKGDFMKNILDRVPATLKNLVIFIFGIVLLLHTLGFFKKGLDKSIIVIAIIMIVYSFIELGGPSKIMSLFSNKNKPKPPSDYDDRF